jgi:hypothetical protein
VHRRLAQISSDSCNALYRNSTCLLLIDAYVQSLQSFVSPRLSVTTLRRMAVTSHQPAQHDSGTDPPESPLSPISALLLQEPRLIVCYLSAYIVQRLVLPASTTTAAQDGEMADLRSILPIHIQNNRHNPTPRKPIEHQILPALILILLSRPNTPQPPTRLIVV